MRAHDYSMEGKFPLQNALIEKAASYWDEQAKPQTGDLILRWWESPALHRLVDLNWSEATGCINAGEYIRKVTCRNSLETGISIGCGAAEDEILLLEQGVLDKLIICDISDEQLNRAEAFAKSRGIDTGRLIRRNMVDFDAPLPERVDLFYWRQSLHHMFDTEQTILWCRDNLSDGGAIYCNDACPPNYMQWKDEVLSWVELYRNSLPPKYLMSPFSEGEYLASLPQIPSVEYWKSVDPTECADSAAIIPAILKHAPSANITYLGGCIFALALNDIINNFRSEDDVPLLRNALLVDKLMSRLGMNYFFTCVIRKRDFLSLPAQHSQEFFP
jgi:SAM-dependent methyltransferase